MDDVSSTTVQPTRSARTVDIDAWRVTDRRISNAAFRLFCLYHREADIKNHARPTEQYLCTELNISPSTLYRLRGELERAGYVTVTKGARR